MSRSRPGLGELVAVGCVLGGVALGVFSATFWSEDGAWTLVLASVAAVAIALGVGLFAVGARRRANASLGIVSVVVCTFVLEMALATRSCGRTRVDKPGFDTRTPLQVVRDLRDAGVPAVPALLPTYVKQRGEVNSLMPLAGVSTATTVFCNESGEFVVYTSDRRGFNNPDSAWNDVEVVLLGDSFAHGQCVQPGEDLASQLRSRGLNAVNLGMAGNGPLAALATLTEYGLALRPEVVVWLYYDNDVGDLAAEMKAPKLAAYLDPSHEQRLVERQAEIDAYWNRFVSTIPEPEVAQRAGFEKQVKDIAQLKNVRGLLGLRRAAAGSLEGELVRVFEEAKRRIEGSGGRLLVVALPSYERVRAGHFDRDADVFRAASRVGVPALCFGETMIATGSWERFYVDGLVSHFTPWGYERLAEAIERELSRDGAPSPSGEERGDGVE